MHLIDSHCHLADSRFDEDLATVLVRSRQAGVTQWVVPVAQQCEWEKLADLLRREAGILAAYGIHPWYAGSFEPDTLERLSLHIKAHRKQTVAVGECGLDFSAGKADVRTQLCWLRAQFDLAEQYQLPLILHAHKSLDILLAELKNRPSLRGVVHGFSGSQQQAERLMEMNFYCGIGTGVTWPNRQRLRDVVAQLPLSAILVESDAPDQPVFAMRGLRNEPAALVSVVEEVARLQGVSADEVAIAVNANANELFQ